MARVEAVVVCLLIVAMDVAAGVLGIQAEKAQSQVITLVCVTAVSSRKNQEVRSGFTDFAVELMSSCLQGRHLRILFIECRQPVRQAYKLGIAAAAVLAASHAIANIVGGCACACCCSGDKLRRSPNRQMASFSLVLTWYAPVLLSYSRE